MQIDARYFKDYRQMLGFKNQQEVKRFFTGKDIVPIVDFNYINLLNKRLIEIIKIIDNISTKSIKPKNLDEFIDTYITYVFKKINENKIILKLNNQGRRPEQVYFSWMRGFVVSNYFLKALSIIFDVDIKNIKLIGDDDLTDIDSFKRTPKADLEVQLKNNTVLRLEIQSGFQGVNDIKQHKVIEAKRLYTDKNISSIVIHFDLFNGQVAFVKIDDIENNDINWITRHQMEGQTVFNIEQNYFAWKLTEEPPLFSSLGL